MEGDAKVFLEKDGTMKEAQVEVMIEGGRKFFWLKEIAHIQTQQPTPEQEGGVEQTREEAQPMQDVEQEETLARHAAWLEEKVTSIQKEKEAMEMAIQGLEAKLALQEGFTKDMAQRYGLIEGAIKRIADHDESQI